MPDHTGRRRRRSNLRSMLPDNLPVGRLFVLFAAIVAILRLLTLSEPAHPPTSGAAAPLTVVPTWSGPAPASQPGRLADGSSYTPRIYVTSQESVGVAETDDAAFWRVLLRRASGEVTELRRVPAADLPQFDGFTVSGDTLVWAESVSRVNTEVSTSLWRANWRTGAKAALITTNTGEANFFGREQDVVIEAGRVSWVAVGVNEQTEIRSVALAGGQVTVQRLQGQYALSAFPWAVSLAGGRGTPMELLNLSTNERVSVATNAAEIATCSPQWCRMAVLGDNALIRIDLQRPDGSQRRRIAGSEATPTITDAAMLDRFVPLKTDRGEGGPVSEVGLSLYDITSDRTDLVATGVANVQAHAGMLWWSTGIGDDLRWHAIDLRTAT